MMMEGGRGLEPGSLTPAIVTLIMGIISFGLGLFVCKYVVSNQKKIYSRYDSFNPPMDNQTSWKIRYGIIGVFGLIAGTAMLGASAFFFVIYFTGS